MIVYPSTPEVINQYTYTYTYMKENKEKETQSVATASKVKNKRVNPYLRTIQQSIKAVLKDLITIKGEDFVSIDLDKQNNELTIDFKDLGSCKIFGVKRIGEKTIFSISIEEERGKFLFTNQIFIGRSENNLKGLLRFFRQFSINAENNIGIFPTYSGFMKTYKKVLNK